MEILCSIHEPSDVVHDALIEGGEVLEADCRQTYVELGASLAVIDDCSGNVFLCGCVRRCDKCRHCTMNMISRTNNGYVVSADGISIVYELQLKFQQSGCQDDESALVRIAPRSSVENDVSNEMSIACEYTYGKS